MTIQKPKELHNKARWDTEIVCTFKELKEDTNILKFTGVYILTEGDEVVYIGSAYTRYLRKRLLQYQQSKNSGNATLYNDLIDAGKTTEKDAYTYITNLTIHAICDESLEYLLIQNCPNAVNLVGKE